MPPKDILRIGKHAQLLRLGHEGRIHDGLRDRIHLPEGGHEGRHVGVVGAEDELAGRDAVVEEATDLVVEDGAGAVVPESGVGGFSGDLVYLEGRKRRGEKEVTGCCRFPLRIALERGGRISRVGLRCWAMRRLRAGAGS